MHFHKLLTEAQEKQETERQALRNATLAANLQLAREKRDREDKEKQDLLMWSKIEQDYTINHDFMTENRETTVSMLAPHRVKPYHFKGLRPD